MFTFAIRLAGQVPCVPACPVSRINQGLARFTASSGCHPASRSSRVSRAAFLGVFVLLAFGTSGRIDWRGRNGDSTQQQNAATTSTSKRLSLLTVFRQVQRVTFDGKVPIIRRASRTRSGSGIQPCRCLHIGYSRLHRVNRTCGYVETRLKNGTANKPACPAFL